MDPVTVDVLKRDPETNALIRRAAEQLQVLGYTEHGFRHASLSASIAGNILRLLGHPQRVVELGEIAAYLHDIGNVVQRTDHEVSSALVAWHVLARLGMDADESAQVMGAIGNHEEERGEAVSAISAAVIIADKADVHRSRVQNPDPTKFDIHDRVNYAAQRSFVRVDAERKLIRLEIDIDTSISQVVEYFEIFLSRMLMTRRASRFLGCEFELVINDVRVL
jgi:hypothetical protein